MYGACGETPGLLELPFGHSRVVGEDLQVDDGAQAELVRGGGGDARVAVVRGGRDPGGERVGSAAARDPEHRLVVERALAQDVRGQPAAERLAVAEAGIDGVLEVRVRVDEARQDHRPVAMVVRASRCDFRDPPVLPTDESVPQRRAVDREYPVGGDGAHQVWIAAVRMRCERRSSRTDSQIEPSKRSASGSVSIVVVIGSTPGSATPMHATTK